MEGSASGINFPPIFTPIKISGFITFILVLSNNAVISSPIPLKNNSSGSPLIQNVSNHSLYQKHSEISRGHYNNATKQVSASSSVKIVHKREVEHVKLTRAEGPAGSLFPGIDLKLTEEYEDVVNSYLNLLLAQEEAKCLRDFGELEPMGTTEFPQDIFRPVLCVKGTKDYFECAQCIQLTTAINLSESCSKHCKTPSCLQRCEAIKSTVNSDLEKFKIGHKVSRLNLEKTETAGADTKGTLIASTYSTYSSVFCEGVVTTPTPTSSSKSSTSSITSQHNNYHNSNANRPAETNYRHFVWLKSNFVQENNNSKHENMEHFTEDKTNSLSPAVVFVIEQRQQLELRNGPIINQSRWTKWITLGKSPYGLEKLHVSYRKVTYQWRVTAVSPEGIMSTSTIQPFTTLDGYVEPGPPKTVHVIESKAKETTVDVLLGWEPPEERTCFYKIVLENRNEDEIARTVRIKGEPLGVHKFWFRDLKFDSVYEVRITSRSAEWHEDESTHASLSFTTPTCLQVHHFRFDKCAPPAPRNLTYVIDSVKSAKTVEIMANPSGSVIFRRSYTVHLKWKPPVHSNGTNVVEEYIVDIRAFSWNVGSNNNNNNNSQATHFMDAQSLLPPMRFKLLGNVTELKVDNLQENAEYTVLVIALSSVGPSPPATLTLKLYSDGRLLDATLSFWVYPCGVLLGVLLIASVCQVVKSITQRRQIKAARDSYFKSIEQRDAFADEWSIVSMTGELSNTWKVLEEHFPRDKWDVGFEDLTIGDILGQGAFGIVRKAEMGRRKYLELVNRHKTNYGKKSRSRAPESVALTDDGVTETVAVKMLKVAATDSDRADMVKELMTMQSLGSHPQIVTLLGVCNTNKSMYLVMEYCPGGNLLSFLRKFREKFLPLLNMEAGGRRGSKASWSDGREYKNNSSNSNQNTWSSSRRSWNSSDPPQVCYTDIQHQSVSSTTASSNSTSEEMQERSVEGRNNSPEQETEECEFIGEKDVLSYARQVALGMAYLERNHIIHRDLACRNILVMGDKKRVKISDFGLSRDIYTWNVYRQKSAGKLPFKWMALESITSRVFTSKSDVWSYGILLWELVTLGAVPYPALENQDLFHMLKSGYRMERPDNCSDELYALMRKCWRTAPADRPNFTELFSYLEAMMETEPEMYLTLQP